jgi:indolepyruvate ferredoxin oxidoreductase beta subunit
LQDFNLVIAGVGGQGSILSSHIIGEAAIRDGYHVRVAETYGAAMRGGAVMGQIRIGAGVREPLIRRGSANALAALEPLEGLRRGVDYLGPKSVAIINTRPLFPVDVNLGRVNYPTMDQILEHLRSLSRHVVTIDGSSLAEKAGSGRSLNVVMVGALKGSRILPLTEKSIREAIRERVPAGTEDINLKAFELGMEAPSGKLEVKH